uniref:Uncharacterized protein n=1 Tax=Schistocephalus solidus TaxID=70667 RepID=A0A0X3Q3L6_SCHSO
MFFYAPTRLMQQGHDYIFKFELPKFSRNVATVSRGCLKSWSLTPTALKSAPYYHLSICLWANNISSNNTTERMYSVKTLKVRQLPTQRRQLSNPYIKYEYQ